MAILPRALWRYLADHVRGDPVYGPYLNEAVEQKWYTAEMKECPFQINIQTQSATESWHYYFIYCHQMAFSLDWRLELAYLSNFLHEFQQNTDEFLLIIVKESM